MASEKGCVCGDEKAVIRQSLPTSVYAAKETTLAMFDKLNAQMLLSKATKKLPVHPLLLAASIGSKVGVKKLIAAKVDPNMKAPSDGASAVHMAVVAGRQEVLIMLLKSGARLDAVTKDGYTPLMASVLSYQTKMVFILTKLTPMYDIDATDELGNTALHLAAKMNWCEAVRLILRAKANRYLRNKMRMTAFDVAMDLENTGAATHFLEELVISKTVKRFIECELELLKQLRCGNEADEQLIENTLLPTLGLICSNEYARRYINFREVYKEVISVASKYHRKESTIYYLDDFIAFFLESMVETHCETINEDKVQAFIASNGPEFLVKVYERMTFYGLSETYLCLSPFVPMLLTSSGKSWISEHYSKIKAPVRSLSASLTDVINSNDSNNKHKDLLNSAGKSVLSRFKDAFVQLQVEESNKHCKELLESEMAKQNQEEVKKAKKGKHKGKKGTVTFVERNADKTNELDTDKPMETMVAATDPRKDETDISNEFEHLTTFEEVSLGFAYTPDRIEATQAFEKVLSKRDRKKRRSAGKEKVTSKGDEDTSTVAAAFKCSIAETIISKQLILVKNKKTGGGSIKVVHPTASPDKSGVFLKKSTASIAGVAKYKADEEKHNTHGWTQCWDHRVLDETKPNYLAALKKDLSATENTCSDTKDDMTNKKGFPENFSESNPVQEYVNNEKDHPFEKVHIDKMLREIQVKEVKPKQLPTGSCTKEGKSKQLPNIVPYVHEPKHKKLSTELRGNKTEQKQLPKESRAKEVKHNTKETKPSAVYDQSHAKETEFKTKEVKPKESQPKEKKANQIPKESHQMETKSNQTPKKSHPIETKPNQIPKESRTKEIKSKQLPKESHPIEKKPNEIPKEFRTKEIKSKQIPKESCTKTTDPKELFEESLSKPKEAELKDIPKEFHTKEAELYETPKKSHLIETKPNQIPKVPRTKKTKPNQTPNESRPIETKPNQIPKESRSKEIKSKQIPKESCTKTTDPKELFEQSHSKSKEVQPEFHAKEAELNEIPKDCPWETITCTTKPPLSNILKKDTITEWLPDIGEWDAEEENIAPDIDQSGNDPNQQWAFGLQQDSMFANENNSSKYKRKVNTKISKRLLQSKPPSPVKFSEVYPLSHRKFNLNKAMEQPSDEIHQPVTKPPENVENPGNNAWQATVTNLREEKEIENNPNFIISKGKGIPHKDTESMVKSKAECVTSCRRNNNSNHKSHKEQRSELEVDEEHGILVKDLSSEMPVENIKQKSKKGTIKYEPTAIRRPTTSIHKIDKPSQKPDVIDTEVTSISIQPLCKDSQSNVTLAHDISTIDNAPPMSDCILNYTAIKDEDVPCTQADADIVRSRVSLLCESFGLKDGNLLSSFIKQGHCGLFSPDRVWPDTNKTQLVDDIIAIPLVLESDEEVTANQDSSLAETCSVGYMKNTSSSSGQSEDEVKGADGFYAVDDFSRLLYLQRQLASGDNESNYWNPFRVETFKKECKDHLGKYYERVMANHVKQSKEYKNILKESSQKQDKIMEKVSGSGDCIGNPTSSETVCKGKSDIPQDKVEKKTDTKKKRHNDSKSQVCVSINTCTDTADINKSIPSLELVDAIKVESEDEEESFEIESSLLLQSLFEGVVSRADRPNPLANNEELPLWSKWHNAVLELSRLLPPFVHHVRNLMMPRYPDKFRIGSGFHGTLVCLGYTSCGKTVAVKRVHRAQMAAVRTQLERLQWEELTHPNILPPLFCVEDSTYHYSVTPVCECNLSTYLHSLSVNSHAHDPFITCRLSHQILHGLAYLHAHKLVHANLKPENVLLDCFGSVRLCDYGLWNTESGNRPLNCQDISWQASEAITEGNCPKEFEALAAADMQVCGMLIYFTLTRGRHPFLDDPSYTEANPRPAKLSLMPICPEADDLVENLLTEEPMARASAKAALCHPFFWENNCRPDFVYKTSILLTEMTRNHLTDLDPFFTSLASLPARKAIVQTLPTAVEIKIQELSGQDADEMSLQGVLETIQKAGQQDSSLDLRENHALMEIICVFPLLPLEVFKAIRSFCPEALESVFSDSISHTLQ